MNSTEFNSNSTESHSQARIKVGRPGEIELIDPVSRQIQLPLRPKSVAAKKSKPTTTFLGNLQFKNVFQWFSKLDKFSQMLLVIFFIGFFRLFFMKEGILDIRAKTMILTDQKQQNDHLENENLELKKEISKIKNDQRYQRRLAREHLGVIGKGEYLILFSKEGDLPK